nr:molybdopterin-guanine dinucleotide biosynthesis protein MobB [Alicyclobacillus kakegawensis]
MPRPLVLSIVGVQDAGKTRLIERILQVWTRQGWRVAVIKHDGHLWENAPDDWEKASSDTERYIHSGAVATVLAGGGRTLWRDMADQAAEQPLVLCRRLADRARRQGRSLDAVLVEGFKSHPLPKLAMIRQASELNWLAGSPMNNLRAVVTTEGLMEAAAALAVPVYRDGAVAELCADIEAGRLGDMRLVSG